MLSLILVFTTSTGRMGLRTALCLLLGWPLSCTGLASPNDGVYRPVEAPRPAPTMQFGDPMGGLPLDLPPGLGDPADPLDESPPGTSSDAAAPARDAGVAGDTGSDAGVRDAASISEPCGFALSLNGTSFASLARSVENDFTLEAWIRTRSSLSGVQAYQSRAIIDADVVGGAGARDFVVGVLNDRFAFGIGDPDLTLQGTSVITTGEWVHVAATRLAATGQLRVFVNGALENADLATNTLPLDSALTMAVGGAVSTRHFIGAIDEVRIWNRERTVDQIRDSRFSVLSEDEPGLVGYYRFEDPDGAGATAEDSSSSNRQATLVGSPSYEPSTALCP